MIESDEVIYGTIGMLPDGEFNPDKKYELLNLVSYDGSSYVVHTDPPKGTPPTDLNYWQVSALGTSKATADSVGTVKPDGTTTEVSTDGSLSVKTATQNTLGLVKGSNGIKVGTDASIDVNTLFTQATELANIIAGEAIASVLGKISKSIAVTMGLNENALLKNILTNMDANDQNKIPTSAFVHTLWARIGMGEDLDIGANLTAVVKALNSNLNNQTIISSGLSLSWGAITVGGYTIIGNLVVLNIRVETNTALVAGTTYQVAGFPTPYLNSANNIPATCSLVSNTRIAYVGTDSRLTFIPDTAITSGSAILFSAFYIKQ